MQLLRGDAAIYIDEQLNTRICLYWGSPQQYGNANPIGVKHIFIENEDILSITNYYNLFNKYQMLHNNYEVYMEQDLEYYSKYSEQKLRRANRNIEFFTKRVRHFEKWFNEGQYFEKQKIKYSDTRTFELLRKNGMLFRTKYFGLFIGMKLSLVSKILGYPAIFIKESVITSFSTFIEYKEAKKNREDYEYRRNKYRYILGNDGLEGKEEQLKKLNEKEDEYKKHFLESGKFITTMLISVITIALTLFYNSVSIANKNREISELKNAVLETTSVGNDKIENLNAELSKIKEKNELSEQEVLKLLIENSNLKVRIEMLEKVQTTNK